ncbi:PTS fructose transporter subunit IIA [Brenneria izadpanahii]|uniref:PTS fructose transporter subunit IIA n=1 Tax=Brenneria izadpanahii TaxID=2722756 RepID=A0ABX7UXR8_9GAMM|nr:PTS fructose transporter subunit IIA [Brenneria izadpanahii]QTF09142.1 PTS fructose transporter subunit IIA [Brenneria izadpanahii]
MINFIVATHGPLAQALLASGKMVYGDLPHVFPVSLDETRGIGGFREDFAAALAQAASGADGVLVLCDMQSGTPWNVASHYAFNPDTQPPVAVLAGVNFPMLLLSDELKHLQSVELAATQLLAQTRDSLVRARLDKAAQSESDDF